MIGERFGHAFDRPLSPLAARVPINPNIITVVGFLVMTAAAVTIPSSLLIGGILILFGGFFDLFDGVLARTNRTMSDFGALLDSTLDRYADSFLFIGIAWYFYERSDLLGILLVLGSLIGSLMISYVRARAEGLGTECTVGLMERPERILLLAFGCITGWIVEVIGILFFLSHLTVLQRVFHVYKKTRVR